DDILAPEWSYRAVFDGIVPDRSVYQTDSTSGFTRYLPDLYVHRVEWPRISGDSAATQQRQFHIYGDSSHPKAIRRRIGSCPPPNCRGWKSKRCELSNHLISVAQPVLGCNGDRRRAG